ncbi:MAG: glycosyltransferase, partial [Bacteroidales bacterium]|nr:glycosyltransferase [Bacteroidales bacterium]
MLIFVAKLIFWFSCIAIIFPYTGYPLFLHLRAKTKKLNFAAYDKNELPLVSIIMAVHNEEFIISNKIQSILNSNYPNHLYEIIIGSDASTDNTNAVLDKFASNYEQISVEFFNKRRGKINIINKLVKKAKADLILFTD